MKLEKQQKDKTEIVKQQKKDIQKIFQSRIFPRKNHTLFEFDLTDKTISKAAFDKRPEISYADALKGKTSDKKEVTRKEKCIYISALNVKNVIKILKRDYNIIL